MSHAPASHPPATAITGVLDPLIRHWRARKAAATDPVELWTAVVALDCYQTTRRLLAGALLPNPGAAPARAPLPPSEAAVRAFLARMEDPA